MSTFEIDHSLTIHDIGSILTNKKQLALSAAAQKRITDCYEYLQHKIKNSDEAFYGINTGFGSLCNTVIPKNELTTLQENLLRSHACGTGNTVPLPVVKLMLLLKIQSLAYGHSGVQLQTVQRLVDFFNLDILPVVYEQGSLGASGDLAPLAHLCLPLIGEGKVWKSTSAEALDDAGGMRGEQECEAENSADALERHNLTPIRLTAKEGLALINGTQFMSACGVWCLLEAYHLSNWADTISCISLEAFNCRLDPFHPALHKIRAHSGQVETAATILKTLGGSALAAQPKTAVQDPYAFRCIPQVHGASKDSIRYVESVFNTEITSVTDNPNVFAEEDLILSGGNFHGQPLAIALDFLAIALAELGSISERRTYQLISGSRGLPAFLTPNAGLNSGMMIPQYTAASIVSQNKQLCTPASVDSIVSSNGQEDHVSMGANAATKCMRVVNNLRTILAIELLNATQALEFRRPMKSSAAIEKIYEAYRNRVPFAATDRYLHADIKASEEFLRT